MRNHRQQLIRQAEGYLELGMYEHALTALDGLGATDQLEADAAYLKGEALRSLERHREALRQLRHAAEAAPEDIHVWLALGWCYKRVERIDLAIQSLEEALAIEPGEALIHYNLACYWSLAGNKTQALEYLSKSFEIDPNYREMVEEETDFDALRNDPDFLALTSVIV